MAKLRLYSYLITTALEETWPEDDRPVLFLGEWCRLHPRRERWSKMNAEVLPYHWDDRDKLYRDYRYLSGFYERMLKALAKQLNEIHKVDHSLRYWRILIGPWLGYFLQMLFDRWSSIDQALNSYEIEKTTILDYPPESLISQGMWDFQDYFVSDQWNHCIYGQILQTKKNISFCHIKPRPYKIGNNSKESHKKRLLRKLARLTSQFLSMVSKEDEAFFMSTYLPYELQWRLEIKLNQLPKFWQPVPAPNTQPDLKMRDWVLQPTSQSAFEKFAAKFISKMLPTVYLEGYSLLVNQTVLLHWPKRPKVIWTSNSYHSDDVFKAWAAEKTESGSPLIIGQHGGHYGVGRWYFLEEHEVAISNRYFSWGWANPNQPKIIPVGQIKHKTKLGINHADQSGLLMVCLTMPRYSYHLYSTIVASQYLDYLNDQFLFVDALPKSIQNELTVRLYHNDYGWDQKNRWKDRCSNIKLDPGEKSIKKLIARSRLCVSTYNATTYLESFTMNIPTVIFWKPNHWELRDSAQPFYDQLMAVGIFHETPQSAASHIASIWNDIDNWWSSKSVSEAVHKFCDCFSYIPENPLRLIYKEIQGIIPS